SWLGDRAVQYRRINRIPDDWGTAVNVQQMVFGNLGPTSGSGVAFSRNEVTGAPEPSGDFLVNAQGEDVVSGVRTPRDLSELPEVMPEANEQLMEILRNLEAHYRDMQNTEFTVEEGQLYMLQTRSAKRPAQAAVRFAVDAVDEGLLSREQAIATIEASSLDALLHPTFSRDADPLVEPDVDESFERVLGWADELRRLGVRTNADTPEDARRARQFGAEGIGLCRTEHMFMAADRQPKMRAMIMAESEEDRRACLGELLPLQQQDFEGLFEEMRGLPVTIRLLDPPLHEFLPSAEELAHEVERARIEQSGDLEGLERTLDRV